MRSSHNFIFCYPWGNHTLVKGVPSLLSISLRVMELCDNNERVTFSVRSHWGALFYFHILLEGRKHLMKKLALLLCLFLLVLQLFSCGIILEEPVNNTPAHTHTLATIPAVEPTCTETGLTQGEKCSTCYEDIIKQEVIPAIGHTTTTGICSRCNTRIGWSQTDVQKIIQIRAVYVDDINSVGGVDMRIQWKNTSSKTIKYIQFTAEPYNAVGDRVPCKIRGYGEFIGKCTGPFEPGYTSWWYWDDTYYGGSLWSNCWYNNTVKTIRITQINIEYMDGTSEIIPNEYTDYAFFS